MVSAKITKPLPLAQLKLYIRKGFIINTDFYASAGGAGGSITWPQLSQVRNSFEE